MYIMLYMLFNLHGSNYSIQIRSELHVALKFRYYLLLQIEAPN